MLARGRADERSEGSRRNGTSNPPPPRVCLQADCLTYSSGDRAVHRCENSSYTFSRAVVGATSTAWRERDGALLRRQRIPSPCDDFVEHGSARRCERGRSAGGSQNLREKIGENFASGIMASRCSLLRFPRQKCRQIPLKARSRPREGSQIFDAAGKHAPALRKRQAAPVARAQRRVRHRRRMADSATHAPSDSATRKHFHAAEKRAGISLIGFDGNHSAKPRHCFTSRVVCGWEARRGRTKNNTAPRRQCFASASAIFRPFASC